MHVTLCSEPMPGSSCSHAPRALTREVGSCNNEPSCSLFSRKQRCDMLSSTESWRHRPEVACQPHLHLCVALLPLQQQHSMLLSHLQAAAHA